MQEEKDVKLAAGLCLEAVQLDPENYRLGHTKVYIYKLETDHKLHIYSHLCYLCP